MSLSSVRNHERALSLGRNSVSLGEGEARPGTQEELGLARQDLQNLERGWEHCQHTGPTAPRRPATARHRLENLEN